MNEPILIQIGTSGPRVQAALGVRRSKAELGHKIPFSEISQELSKEF